jgi:hypothetical protein
MINAIELRIGNLVSIGTEDKKLLAVEKIGKTGINGCLVRHEYMDSEGVVSEPTFEKIKFEDLQPAPLTTDIILSAVEQAGGVVIIDRNTFTISIAGVEITWPLDDKGGIAPHSKHKYVHQLQNIYFALTSQELEVKL